MVSPMAKKQTPMTPPPSAGWLNTPLPETSFWKPPAAPISRSTGCHSTAFRLSPASPPSSAGATTTSANGAPVNQQLLAEIDRRQADVAAMFADPDSPLFDTYGVAWLFVGEYESGDWRTECETAGPYDIAPLLEESDSGLA